MPTMNPSQALSSCEQALRELLTIVLSKKLGPTWIKRVCAPEEIARLEEKREVERKRRTNRGAIAVPTNLISYAEFTNLIKWVRAYWDDVAPALGKKKEIEVFLDRFEALRNAVAHSRELLVFEEELLSAIAGEIRNRVTIYMSSMDPAGDYFPRIEWVTDNLGNNTENAQKPSDGAWVVPTTTSLRPGDRVSFRCRGTDPQGRTLSWTIRHLGGVTSPVQGSDVDLTWDVAEHNIGQQVYVNITLKSSSSSHRTNGADGYDAVVTMMYNVLPPMSGTVVRGEDG
ncbi:hypothetical protein ACFW9L_09895 [Streptomyces sp. NPDC059517]|uniref:hypothetical protein n=1 Tax=Streptomyces sp. NPDC059517 TaxID=3346855 RepID=UPI0036C4C64A